VALLLMEGAARGGGFLNILRLLLLNISCRAAGWDGARGAAEPAAAAAGMLLLQEMLLRVLAGNDELAGRQAAALAGAVRCCAE
jgi:hypothetical protein